MKFGDLEPGDVFRWRDAVLVKVNAGFAFAIESGDQVDKGDSLSMYWHNIVTPLDVHFTAREPGERRDSNER